MWNWCVTCACAAVACTRGIKAFTQVQGDTVHPSGDSPRAGTRVNWCTEFNIAMAVVLASEDRCTSGALVARAMWRATILLLEGSTACRHAYRPYLLSACPKQMPLCAHVAVTRCHGVCVLCFAGLSLPTYLASFVSYPPNGPWQRRGTNAVLKTIKSG